MNIFEIFGSSQQIKFSTSLSLNWFHVISRIKFKKSNNNKKRNKKFSYWNFQSIFNSSCKVLHPLEFCASPQPKLNRSLKSLVVMKLSNTGMLSWFYVYRKMQSLVTIGGVIYDSSHIFHFILMRSCLLESIYKKIGRW